LEAKIGEINRNVKCLTLTEAGTLTL
jgi:hypothetical protein